VEVVGSNPTAPTIRLFSQNNVRKQIIRNLISSPLFQPMWLIILKLCHAGMNCGGGQNVTESGEIHALKFTARTLGFPKPFILFDVGANQGLYLRTAFEVLGQDLTAYSFEPQSASFKKLQEAMANHPPVHLRQVAVGKEPGEAQLKFQSDLDIGASIRSQSEIGAAFTETVPIITIDDFCEQEGIQRIDLLKIDTEGYEMEVLLGASKTLAAGAIRAIQFEFGETFLTTPYHFIDLWELLSSRYRIYRILRRGLVELRNYSPDHEVYKLTNFLCIRKTR
jgi:FkbM family methyltransferase